MTVLDQEDEIEEITLRPKIWQHDIVYHEADHCMKWPPQLMFAFSDLGRPRVLSFSARLVISWHHYRLGIHFLNYDLIPHWHTVGHCDRVQSFCKMFTMNSSDDTGNVLGIARELDMYICKKFHSSFCTYFPPHKIANYSLVRLLVAFSKDSDSCPCI